MYRVNDLSDKRHLYKIDINAVENHLTGVCVTTPGVNVVVVEGDRKGMRRFNRLMLHRIDWNPLANANGADDDMFEELNKCYVVWRGAVAAPAFTRFATRKCDSEQEGRDVLAQRGVVHYWDSAHSFVPTADAEVS